MPLPHPRRLCFGSRLSGPPIRSGLSPPLPWSPGTAGARRPRKASAPRPSARETPVTVRSAGGRVLPVDVRGILGKVTLAGANTTDENCGGAGTSKIADCAQTTRAFSRATVHAASPRPGVVTFKGVANVRLATADCPLEPADVSAPAARSTAEPRAAAQGNAERAKARKHQSARNAESAQGLRLAAAGAPRRERRMEAEARTSPHLIREAAVNCGAWRKRSES